MAPTSTEQDKKTKRKAFKLESYVAGCGAGFTNVAVTYPLHKLMFRQMLHNVPATKAVEQLQKEGLRLLYRGFLPPLCQRMISISIMFGSYDTYGQLLMQAYPNVKTQVTKSGGAALAGLNEALLLAPFERIQTLLQDREYNSKFKNSYQAVTHIAKQFGLVEFYRGFSIVVFRNSASSIVFFAAKEKVESLYPNSNNMGTKFVTDFVSGSLLGAAISTMYYPLNVVRARMQSRLGGSFESPRSVFKTVLLERQGSIRGMYRGVHLNYTRAFLSWGINNASFEFLKKLLVKDEDKDS